MGGQNQKPGGEGTLELDAVEAALEAGLRLATKAGQREAVAQLVKELEARRLLRASSNVVSIKLARPKKSRRYRLSIPGHTLARVW